jgi:RimJ/RimL family protein N-acetyltransferase
MLVRLCTSSGVPVQELDGVDNTYTPLNQWVTREVMVPALTARQGEALRISYEATTDSSNVSSFFLDNIAFEALAPEEWKNSEGKQMKHNSLFESKRLLLTAIDLEKDMRSIASWTYDLEITAKMRESQPARPMAAFEVKKLFEQWQKESEENNRQFLFCIRARQTQEDAQTSQSSIIGVARITQIEWVHGAAFLDLILGDEKAWQAYAQEALSMVLRYAFEELGLFRVTSIVPEHNRQAIELFEQSQFTLEVRQRQAVYWNRRTWDKFFFGLLRPEWEIQQPAEVNA